MPVEDKTAVTLEDARVFFYHDPLVAVLLRVTGVRAWPVGVLGLIVFGIFMGGGGALVSVIHGPDAGFLSLLDPREFYWVAFIYFVLAPIICIAYAAEPINIFHLFRGLWNSGVILGENMTFEKVKDFLAAHIAGRKHVAWLVTICALTVTVGVIWLGSDLAPDDPFRFGAVRFWWTISPLYFWAVWFPLNFSLTYMLLWIVLRRGIAWRVMTKALQDTDLGIRPKLRDPDGVNGMAPIGDYFLRFAPLVALSGIWVGVSMGYPVLFGQHWNIKLNTILFGVGYFSAIPVSLIVPIWSAHCVMRDARRELLRRLGDEIQRLLPRGERQAPSIGTREWIEQVDTLDREYQIAERAYRTWPFRRPKFLGSLVVALGPLLSAGASVLVQRMLPVVLQKLVS